MPSGFRARSAPSKRGAATLPPGIPKAPTGIEGLDEITGGGLPRGRPTLVCGSAGCGKTLFAIEFLVRGATQFGEPGVFMAFEETAAELAANVQSLGFPLDKMVANHQLLVDQVRVERSEIEETGDYNLDGIFIRLAHAIDTIQAKRVVLDTIENLFSGFTNVGILRAELRRLFGWLKERGVTAIITGERGDGQLTRQGLEEYVSDCVILLDHRVIDQRSTRRLRIVKYRGSAHGTNEYPFLIDEQGISVFPITSVELQHPVSNEIVSTGVPAIDGMLGAKGLYRGTSVLLSGTAGTGKTSVCSDFIREACQRGERCLLFAYEESQEQIVRNMRSIGVDLQPWIDKGLLQVHSTRPSAYGLEMHLVAVHKLVQQFEPQDIVMDPISNLISVGNFEETNAMLLRVVDFFKTRNITALYTSLTTPGGSMETSDVGISSLIDTWFLLRNVELNGERNRTLFVLKSRGMNHSNKVREFLLTSHGIELREAYLGSNGVLTGSARQAQEVRDREDEMKRLEKAAHREGVMAVSRRSIEAQIDVLRAELEVITNELELSGRSERLSKGRMMEKTTAQPNLPNRLLSARDGGAAEAIAP